MTNRDEELSKEKQEALNDKLKEYKSIRSDCDREIDLVNEQLSGRRGGRRHNDDENDD